MVIIVVKNSKLLWRRTSCWNNSIGKVILQVKGLLKLVINLLVVMVIKVSWQNCTSRDMPFLEDGTPVDIVLNPLGVPSRMT